MLAVFDRTDIEDMIAVNPTHVICAIPNGETTRIIMTDGGEIDVNMEFIKAVEYLNLSMPRGAVVV